MENRSQEDRGSNLPTCATEFIRQVVRRIGYRRKARREVEAELTAHFEEELRGCTEAQEKEQRAQRLIEQFGDAKLLAVLCRRGKKRCRPLWAKTMVRVLQAVGVLVVLLSLYTVWFVNGKPSVTVDYLALWNRTSRPDITAEDNAWSHYEQAAALVVPPGHELQEMAAFRNPDDAQHRDFAKLPHEARRAIERWIGANRPAWEHFTVASSQPYLAVPYQNHRDIADRWLFRITLPDLSAMDLLSRVGIWQSRIDLERGRTAEALESSLTVARVGAHWQRSGTPLEQLAGLRISRMGHKAVLQVVASMGLSVDELSDLQRKLASIYRESYPLVDAEYEHLVLLDMVQHVFTNAGPGGGHLVPPSSRGLVHTAMKESYPEVVKIPFLRTALSVIHAGRAETVVTVERLFDRYRKLSFLSPYQRRTRGEVTLRETVESLPKHRYALVRSLVPSLDRMIDIRFQGRALHQATLTVLALERYRQEKGSYPATLEELKQAGYLDTLPADPYSNGPLTYRAIGDGFTLYSVGPDFVDNGGTPGTDSKGRRRLWADQGDTVFWPAP
jgi:hypothetical protein